MGQSLLVNHLNALNQLTPLAEIHCHSLLSGNDLAILVKAIALSKVNQVHVPILKVAKPHQFLLAKIEQDLLVLTYPLWHCRLNGKRRPDIGEA
jgi:hypothetical protein